MTRHTEYHTKQAADKLVGGKIVGIAIASASDSDFDDRFWGLEIVTKDGRNLIAWISQDEEGNGPGVIDYQEV